MRIIPSEVQFTVAPGAEGAREARRRLDRLVAPFLLSRGQQEALRLAASEIITNLGVHPDRKPTRVALSLKNVAGVMLFEIEDDGSPFAGFSEAWPRKGLPIGLEESGMGLGLVAGHFPCLTYCSRDDSNRIRFQFHAEESHELPVVLLTDDDPTARNIYGLYLSESYRVIFADTADEALQLLRRANFDLVISDIRMPGGASGLELCAEVRADRALAALPFIFLTGEKAEKTQQDAAGLAIDDYLVKPIRKEPLLRCTQRVVRNARFVRSRLGDRFDEDLTRLLHPSLPARVGSLDASVRWRSAEAGGGDLIYHRDTEQGTLIVLADLMGHGEQAKFFSHVLSGYLYGVMSALPHSDLSSVLAQLNDAFADNHVLSKTLATVMVIHITPDGSTSVAAAGHPAPFVCLDGATRQLSVEGPLLGISPDARFNVTTFRMRDGDRMCLFSDGLIEVGRSPEQRASNRASIEEGMAGIGRGSIDEASDRIMEQLLELSGGGVQDDVTVVVLEYAPVRG